MIPSTKLPYVLAKNSHDVLNVHKLDFAVLYFMVFVHYKFFSACCTCCSEMQVLLCYDNKVLTLFICENCTAVMALETMYYINKCNSSNIKKLFLAPRYYELSLLRTLNRGTEGVHNNGS